MPGLFSRLKGRDGRSKKKDSANSANDNLPKKQQWDDAYTRKTVEPEEIHELIRCCNEELKARALDLPFLLLPFRPTSDPSAVRTFIRHFFGQNPPMRGEALIQEVRMLEPMVIAGVTKWCWSRLSGGIVGWDAYELFKVGEFDSNMARDSFKTFIPISVENGARQRIIFDFFDLLAAIAAHGKRNGLGGRKLSRMAAWWAFEQKDTKKGFEGGYNSWLSAADATSHLFFAYLRSLSPEQALTGISMLPMSLQKLVQETEYPPVRPELMMSRTNKVVMVVDAVSPTPFALLRRANHFQYRDSDQALQEYSTYEDPIKALTDECCRVLKAVSAANQSHVSSSKHSTGLRDASWSRFEDIGFTSALEEEDEDDDRVIPKKRPQQGLMTTSQSATQLGRPTTPSWADFLSSGFVDDGHPRSNLLLPPDKVLPPIEMQARQRSSQSHRPRLESDTHLEPGELASITVFDLDDAFWWVWMSSLAPEETPERKSAFGRCAVIETVIRSGRWLVMEEMVAGAAPEPAEGAYIAEKKGFFSWTRRSKTLNRRKSIAGNKSLERGDKNSNGYGASKTSIGPDTHAKIQAKAAQLRAAEDRERQQVQQTTRRGRPNTEIMHEKTNSVLTLQPNIVGEASMAMKWAKKYDKGAIKDAYMANSNAGRGVAVSPAPTDVRTNGVDDPNGTHETTNTSNGLEQPPTVPSKEVVPPIPEQPTSQNVPEPATEPETVDIKAEEAGVHPASQPEPEPMSPVPPPKDAEQLPDRAQMVSPEPTPLEPTNTNNSPDGKKKKLHKDHKEKTGGFRKLFGRKNRSSKLPENASADLNGMLKQEQAAKERVPQSQTTSAAPSAPASIISTTNDEPGVSVSAQQTPIAAQSDQSLPTPKAPQPEQFPEPENEPERTYTPDPAPKPPHTRRSEGADDLHKLDSHDEDEAKREFSRFDQGPLDDQPAFVPDEDVDDDDATPPPISRHPRSSEVLNKNFNTPPPEERLSHTAGPGVQDRWAQIRKNAAERAAVRQSEEQSHGAQSKTTDGDDDTSGEETIESRVARIKARVAELTGNMEGSSGPQQQPVAPQGAVRR